MKRLNIGFDCLLIFFNLFACHNSYIMASKQCDQQTTSENEAFADWDFDERNFLPKTKRRPDKLGGNNSGASSSQKMVDDSNKEQLSKLSKRSSVDCSENKKEQTDNFLIRLFKQIFPGKEKPSQESSLELSLSSFSDQS